MKGSQHVGSDEGGHNIWVQIRGSKHEVLCRINENYP